MRYDYLAQVPKHNNFIFYNRSALLCSGYFSLHNVSLTTDCIMWAEWLSIFVKTLRVQKLVQHFHPAQLQEGGNLVWHKPSH